MKLKNMTDPNLILFDVEADYKEQAIKQLISTLFKEGYLESEQPFLEAVLQREEVSPTGMERGLAIPHGKSLVVKKAVFAVAKLTTPLDDWESIDPTNKVQLVFLIAIPESEGGTTHLKVLSTLSTNLMRDGYLEQLMAAKSSEEFLNRLDITEKEETKSESFTKTVVAVTACATGIAHTYMAAEALEKAGRELGVNVLVEKQGANGIEDTLTADVIEKADAVILATDIAPKQKERFAGKPYVQTRVAEPLRHGKDMIQKALTNPDGVVEKNESDDAAAPSSQGGGGFLKDTVQAVMTGISYMIPVIVAAGLMMGIAKLGAMPFGLVNELGDPKYATHSNELFVILHHLDLFGGLIFKFMYPIFAAFVAYSLADRVGLVSGFIGGAFAGGLHYTFWGIADGIPSGFLGALILGLAAGYISRFLNQKIQLNKNFQAMKPMFLIPAISVLSIFFLNFYIVDPVFGGLNVVLRTWIESAQGTGDVVLASIIAAATAFDLGGPINKAAGAIAIGLAADEVYPLTARVLAIVIPPIGLGLATVIDKYVVGRRVFEADLRVAGNTALLLGFIAISEGAIPFMLRNPLITIPINIIGAILGASTAVLLGAVQWLPLPAFWGWPLVENLWAYLLGLLVGAAFIAFANIFVRFTILKKKESHA